MTLELRHLRYIATVAAEGGFGRAAAALHVAQPALSRQVRALEEEIGVRLLLRTPKGVSVTPAGYSVLAGAARVLAEFDEAVDATREAASGLSGRCRVGVAPAVMTFPRISALMSRLPEATPGVGLEVLEADARHFAEKLLAREIDVGIASGVGKRPGLAREVVMTVALRYAALSSGHRLAGRIALTPDDLADVPVLFLSSAADANLSEVVRDGLDRAAIRSPREFAYASERSLFIVVVAGRGWTPASDAMRERLPEGVTLVPVEGLDIALSVDLLWRRSESGPAVVAVLDALRSLRDGEGAKAPRVTPDGGPRLRRSIDLRHLRYFASVVDEGSFSRAAERFGITQPSLSRQVADLEYHVGTALLERSARGVTATDTGRVLRAAAARVLAAVDAMVAAARAARRGLAGRCVIGTVNTATSRRVIMEAIRECAARWPDVEILLEDQATPRQPVLLRESRIDLGIGYVYTGLIEDPSIATERLLDDVIDCALVAEGHRLAGRGRLRASDLADEPLLFISRGFHAGFHDLVMDALGRLGLTPVVEATYDSLHHILLVAAEGRGWALGAASLRAAPPHGLVALPVEGLAIPWGLDLLWRRDEPNPVVGRILDVLRQARGRAAEPASPPSRPTRAKPARRPRSRG